MLLRLPAVSVIVALSCGAAYGWATRGGEALPRPIAGALPALGATPWTIWMGDNVAHPITGRRPAGLAPRRLVSMGDDVAHVRPIRGVLPPHQPTPWIIRMGDDVAHVLPVTRPGGRIGAAKGRTHALPVASLAWVALDGEARVQDLSEQDLDLATDALSPPPGAWSDVEITLADGAWRSLDGLDQDLSGQTLTVALEDPESAGPLTLALGADLDDALLLGSED